MTSLHKTNTLRHIGLLLALLWTSCTKTTNTIPVVTTASSIAAIVKNATNLTLFDSALSKTGLIKTLDSAGPTSPYTLFAPPDAAFACLEAERLLRICSVTMGWLWVVAQRCKLKP